MQTNHHIFWIGCLLEGFLIILALALGHFTDQSPWGGWKWELTAVAWGLLATIPMLGLFHSIVRSQYEPFQAIREFLDTAVRPMLGNCSVLQLLGLSILAGLGEEMLFRAVIQGELTDLLGPSIGLVLASALFGMMHWITRTYALLAALIGLFLGALWMWTGNLLAPVITHTAYDFIALVYWLKWQKPPSPSKS